jgi:hypothetical protein
MSPPDPGADDPVWAEVRALLGQIMFGAAIDYAADTMDALWTERADAIVTNDFLAGPVIAAEASGIHAPCLRRMSASVRSTGFRPA